MPTELSLDPAFRQYARTCAEAVLGRSDCLVGRETILVAEALLDLLNATEGKPS